ncbi:hypothetical protein ASPCAL01047 [Aspergillus calidoustus]|uniref:Uncharacterized protein n=1 Tax=Aspergillus calidoustus TaxID=454130 RepID=A0A0U5C2N0_ASPCI|nr:hypothetical protein ASPCAL01047 [Aspergillus calidoustus]
MSLVEHWNHDSNLIRRQTAREDLHRHYRRLTNDNYSIVSAGPQNASPILPSVPQLLSVAQSVEEFNEDPEGALHPETETESETESDTSDADADADADGESEYEYKFD